MQLRYKSSKYLSMSTRFESVAFKVENLKLKTSVTNILFCVLLLPGTYFNLRNLQVEDDRLSEVTRAWVSKCTRNSTLVIYTDIFNTISSNSKLFLM
jgi:hypothetical protein